MAKKDLWKALIPSALALWGCASVESHKVGDNAYSIICSKWRSACSQKADELCGKENYQVVKDTTLDYCYTADTSEAPCKWRAIVQCSQKGN